MFVGVSSWDFIDYFGLYNFFLNILLDIFAFLINLFNFYYLFVYLFKFFGQFVCV